MDTRFDGRNSRVAVPSTRHGSLRLEQVAWVVLVLALVQLARVIPLQPLGSALESWLASLGGLGAVAFVILYTLSALLFVPGSVLTAAAGALFGVALGTALVSLASTLTAALAFLIARHLARDTVARRAATDPRFRAIDRAIGQGGWRVVALLRLSPVVPFSLGNYLFGLTAVRFWPHVLASWLAMLPGTVLYVYLGQVGRASLEAVGDAGERGAAQWSLLAIGLLATVVVVVYVTRLAKRALAEQDLGVAHDAAAPPAAAPRPSAGVATLALAIVLACAALYATAHRDELRTWADALSSDAESAEH